MERVRGLEPLQDGLKSVIRTPCSAFALWVSIFDSHFRTSNLDAPPMPSRAQHKYDERSTMCLRKIKHSVFVSDEACGAYTLSMYDRYPSFPACPLSVYWHPMHTYPYSCLTWALSFACSACTNGCHGWEKRLCIPLKQNMAHPCILSEAFGGHIIPLGAPGCVPGGN